MIEHMLESRLMEMRRVVRENIADRIRLGLEHEPPGEELGTLLAVVRPSDLDMYDLVSLLGACERQIAWVQAKQLAAVAELSGRRLVPGPHGEPADSPFPDGSSNDFAADEVAAALCLARVTGQQRVWLANALTRLPETAAAFAAGALTLAKVKAIVEELAVLDDEPALAAEARVLGRAPDQTLGNLRRSLARAVAAADPAAAARRAAQAHTERRCILTPQPNGMCEFYALLPAPEAMALWTAVTALADQARTADRTNHADHPDHPDHPADPADPADTTDMDNPADMDNPGPADAAANGDPADHGDHGDHGDPVDADGATRAADPSETRAADTHRESGDAAVESAGRRRTMDQARADVLADMAYATLDREDLPRNHRRRPHIQITLAATTALGLDDQPGELAGYGPITAATARRLAAEGTWRRLLTDPATGGLLDYGRTTYQPPQNLVDHILTRDQTCRGLGCRIPAQRCDLDHTLPFPAGPTADHNLTCLCRRCHTRKHQAGWTLHLHPDGDLSWTSPTGHTYTDPASPVLDTAPTTRPRAPAQDTPPF
jgi:Domain of unknown function (DUF222)